MISTKRKQNPKKTTKAGAGAIFVPNLDCFRTCSLSKSVEAVQPQRQSGGVIQKSSNVNIGRSYSTSLYPVFFLIIVCFFLVVFKDITLFEVNVSIELGLCLLPSLHFKHIYIYIYELASKIYAWSVFVSLLSVPYRFAWFWILQVCQSPIVFQGKSRKQHRDETSLTKVVDEKF